MSKFNGTISGSGYGYVYIMSYPGSDKLKIGHSLNPTTRAEDIGGTLAPETPVLEAYYWCSERREDVERKAHDLERHNRANGEWFDISVEKARAAIETAAEATGVEIQLVFCRDAGEVKKEHQFKTKEERQVWLRERLEKKQTYQSVTEYGYDAEYVRRNPVKGKADT